MDIRNILPFLRKEQPEVAVNKIAVVINVTNHASLIAGVLYVLLAKRHSTKEMTLIDVRDPIAADQDLYVWVNSGTLGQFKEYHHSALGVSQNLEEDKAWYKHISSRSTFLIPSLNPNRDVDQNTVGIALTHGFEQGLFPREEFEAYMRYAVLAEKFESDAMGETEACLYYDTLQQAYYPYMGYDVKIEEIRLCDPSVEEVELFTSQQSEINRAIARKYRVINLGGRSFYYITTMGKDIHGLIRRIRLAKKDFIHVSAGSYGNVVYASSTLPMGFDMGKGVLNLTPVSEPLRQYK